MPPVWRPLLQSTWLLHGHIFLATSLPELKQCSHVLAVMALGKSPVARFAPFPHTQFGTRHLVWLFCSEAGYVVCISEFS